MDNSDNEDLEDLERKILELQRKKNAIIQKKTIDKKDDQIMQYAPKPPDFSAYDTNKFKGNLIQDDYSRNNFKSSKSCFDFVDDICFGNSQNISDEKDNAFIYMPSSSSDKKFSKISMKFGGKKADDILDPTLKKEQSDFAIETSQMLEEDPDFQKAVEDSLKYSNAEADKNDWMSKNSMNYSNNDFSNNFVTSNISSKNYNTQKNNKVEPVQNFNKPKKNKKQASKKIDDPLDDIINKYLNENNQNSKPEPSLNSQNIKSDCQSLNNAQKNEIKDQNVDDIELTKMCMSKREHELLMRYNELNQEDLKELATSFGIKQSQNTKALKFQLKIIYEWHFNNNLDPSYTYNFDKQIKQLFRGI